MIHIDNKKTTIDTSDSITPKLIFIVPYRDREQQLIFFKRHIEYILEDYEKKNMIYYISIKPINAHLIVVL